MPTTQAAMMTVLTTAHPFEKASNCTTYGQGSQPTLLGVFLGCLTQLLPRSSPWPATHVDTAHMPAYSDDALAPSGRLDPTQKGTFVALAQFVIHAGNHNRHLTPMLLPMTPAPGGQVAVRDLASGALMPGQATAGGVAFILPDLEAGGVSHVEVDRVSAQSAGVQVHDNQGELVFDADGVPITHYHYTGDGLARPYFWPVHGPAGRQVTRAFPMVSDAPGETRDHPHHRSLWVAYGELDGVDAWTESTHTPNHGRTVHEAFDDLESGPVFAGFVERLRWVDSQGWEILTERRTVRVCRLADDARMIDIALHWTFERKDGRGRRYSLGAVHVGDTKEGGLVAVRVATSMDAKELGRIENAWGGVQEAETWGRRAPRCDYSGPVDGATVGIAAFDHPDNLKFPCYWHVRNYGLMGSNPWSGETFTGNPLENGAVTYPAGTTLDFRYRVYLHAGSATEGQVSQRWSDFAFPPVATATGA